MNLLLLNFNNYFNRTIKKYSSINDYISNAKNYSWAMDAKSINFIPNDGITTGQIINFKENWEPNYLIVVDEISKEIVSRWFIIESIRTREGQFKLQLKRDCIVDYFNEIISSPCFIEKASVQSISDICIYNTEDVKLNQIKQSETLLKDVSGKGWLIGYISSNTPQTPINIQDTSIPFIYEADYDTWPLKQYISDDWKTITSFEAEITTWIRFSDYTNKICTIKANDSSYSHNINDYSGEPVPNSVFKFVNSFYYNYPNIVGNSLALKAYQVRSQMKDSWIGSQSEYKTSNLSYLHDKYIYFAAQDKYYKISISRSSDSVSITNELDSAQEAAINNPLIGYRNYDATYYYPDPESRPAQRRYANTKANLTYTKDRITLSEVSLSSLTTAIPNSANILSDAPYKMFAIPYGSITINDTTNFDTLSENVSLNVASTIAKTLGGTNNYIYDLQLLPYCPMIERITNNSFLLTGLEEHIDYEYIKDADNNKKGIILFPTYSRFTFDINYNLTVPNTVENFKIENEAKLYRLMSPNGSAQFDFKITKTGSITKFNIDCTYKPYTPYIHINPNWGNLYGSDFNDYRGLICQGDFSVPVINDQWVQYQINNKNYLNTFNRETDSLEVQYKFQRMRNILGAGVGALSGAASGAMTGGFATGSPIGALVGAVVGGVSSAVGGAADVAITDKLHKEQMSLREDQFNFNMQNIQARPQTLAKTSALDSNNKIFPYLECYDCTEQEKQILKDKMKYEGMKIMKVSTISSYLSSTESYIRGNMIIINDIEGDYHLVNDIKNEVAMGLRIKE